MGQWVVMKLYAADLDFHAIAEEFGVAVAFAPEVEQEAAALGDRLADTRIDRRDLALVTIDPPGSMDLDQALHIEKTPTGYRVSYAIADVAAFVSPDSRVGKESLKRGQTIYLPDTPARLHPAHISEGKASLLPGVDRPCVLWTIELGQQAEVVDYRCERALIRSRARFDYEGVQRDVDSGRAHPSIALLPTVGQLRARSALRRDAINLRAPSQTLVRDESGQVSLELEPRVKAMDYNSEISLLAGMCAGELMAQAGVGVLRTLAPADDGALVQFRKAATALGFAVPDNVGTHDAAALLASIDADAPRGMALMREAKKLLRGAGYQKLGEGQEPVVHAGVGGYYAHVTAPLRRLIDRYGQEVCLALSSGEEVPEWVGEGLDQVLATMNSSSQVAALVDRACLDLTEAVVLAPWRGENFQAVVMESAQAKNTARVFIEHPPVFGTCVGAPPVGTGAVVTLVRADVASRDVAFAWPAD